MKKFVSGLLLVAACTHPKIPNKPLAPDPIKVQNTALDIYYSDTEYACIGSKKEPIKEIQSRLDNLGYKTYPETYDKEDRSYWINFNLKNSLAQIKEMADKLGGIESSSIPVTFLDNLEKLRALCKSKIAAGCFANVNGKRNIYVYNKYETQTSFSFDYGGISSSTTIPSHPFFTLGHEIGHSKTDIERSNPSFKELEANLFGLKLINEWTKKNKINGNLLFSDELSIINANVKRQINGVEKIESYQDLEAAIDKNYIGDPTLKELKKPYSVADLAFAILFSSLLDIDKTYKFVHENSDEKIMAKINEILKQKGMKSFEYLAKYIEKLDAQRKIDIRNFELEQNESGDVSCKENLGQLAFAILKFGKKTEWDVRKYTNAEGKIVSFGRNSEFIYVAEFDNQNLKLEKFYLQSRCHNKGINFDKNTGEVRLSFGFPFGEFSEIKPSARFPYIDNEKKFEIYCNFKLKEPQTLKIYSSEVNNLLLQYADEIRKKLPVTLDESKQ